MYAGAFVAEQGLLSVFGHCRGGGVGCGEAVDGCGEHGGAGGLELEPADQHAGGVTDAGQAPPLVGVGVEAVFPGGVEHTQQVPGQQLRRFRVTRAGVGGDFFIDHLGT